MSDLLLDPAFVSRLDRLDVLSRKILGGKLRGERLGRRRGESMELADFRDYSAGDDPRFVDWNILARLDRLMVKLFKAEEEIFLHILLDASGSMNFGEPNKWNYLCQVAAALGYVGLCNGHHVRVWAISNEPHGESELLRGRGAVWRLMRFIEGLRPGGPTRFADACRRLALRREHRGVCVVLSDFLFEDGLGDGQSQLGNQRLSTPLAQPTPTLTLPLSTRGADKSADLFSHATTLGLEIGLGTLAAAGHDVFCVQALSPQETDPVETGELRLADSESGTEAEVRISPADIAAYGDRLAELCGRVERQVERHGGRFLRTQTSVPFDLLVLEGLRRGRLVG